MVKWSGVKRNIVLGEKLQDDNRFKYSNGAMKLFNVNSHSIDDVEAELNGKNKNEIVQMFYDCFANSQMSDHFKKFWSELEIDEDGKICFSN